MKNLLLIITIVSFTFTGYANTPEKEVNFYTDEVTWANMPPILQTFYRVGSAVLGEYMYVFGSPTANYVQAFNYVTEQWEIGTPPPFGTMHYAAVATDTDIYLIGRQAGVSYSDVQKFTPFAGSAQGTWISVADYPQEAAGVSAAWDGGNYIYAAGGTNFSSYDEAYRYDIAADQWTQIANMPTWETHAGGHFMNGKFYVVGGYYNQNRLLEYTPGTDSWEVKAEIPVGVSHTVGCVSGTDHILYVVGGGGPYYNMLPVAEPQIYDPYTDTWSIETLMPEALGMNAAKYVGNGTVIVAGGTQGGWDYSLDTYKGVGFPEGGPPVAHDVTIALEPYSTPIQIPANGGTFEFNIAAVNNEASAVTFDVWTYVTLPNGSEYGPIININEFELAGSGSANRDRTQVVPASAPSGSYTYDAYVGIYPNFIWDEDYFQFEKLAVDDGGQIVDGWDVFGVGFGDNEESGVSMTPESHIVLSAYPNPFNPATTISYRLSANNHVTLKVYDISGREAAKLVDGIQSEGIHEATFDASELSSGVYFAKLTVRGQHHTQKLLLVK